MMATEKHQKHPHKAEPKKSSRQLRKELQHLNGRKEAQSFIYAAHEAIDGLLKHDTLDLTGLTHLSLELSGGTIMLSGMRKALGSFNLAVPVSVDEEQVKDLNAETADQITKLEEDINDNAYDAQKAQRSAYQFMMPPVPMQVAPVPTTETVSQKLAPVEETPVEAASEEEGEGEEEVDSEGPSKDSKSE